MFKENDALAPEAACEKDEDYTGLKTWSGFCGTNGFADLMCSDISLHTCIGDQWAIIVGAPKPIEVADGRFGVKFAQR